MKTLALCCLVLVGSLASRSSALGATIATYTASADPNSSPDANGNTLNVWTTFHAGDGAGGSSTYSGSYYATGVSGLGTAWGIYSNHNYTSTLPAGSEQVQTASFLGGALSIGQTVSIDFLANAVDTGQQYGIRLLNGTGFVLALSFTGGDGGYRYYDATSSGNIPFGYQSNGFHFAFTLTGATTYRVVATPIGGGAQIGAFTGTISGAPDTIQIYNRSAGVNNNVLTNNLAIVPEPSTWALALGGAGLLGGMARRRRGARG